ncbi:MAG: flavoprotein [Pirellulaceae bacterium]
MPKAEIVIGVGGGVAAYKTAMLVSQLVQHDFSVHVVLSRTATQFIGPATFAALTGRQPVLDLFDHRYPLGAHIELARSADLFCVAPATANFLAKAATGLSDDLLSTLYLCCTCPVLVCPAMNVEMWQKASVQRNFEQLKSDGVVMIGPESGWLSCRTKGMGRMSEPTTIFEAILENSKKQS